MSCARYTATAAILSLAAPIVLCFPALAQGLEDRDISHTNGDGEYRQVTEDLASKIEFGLLAEMVVRADHELLIVGVWLRQSYDPNVERRAYVATQVAQERDDIEARAKQRLADTRRPIVEWFRAQGWPVVYECRLAPAVFVELPVSGVRATAARVDVDRVYLSLHYTNSCHSVPTTPTAPAPPMEHAVKSVRADVVWARGYDGSGLEGPVVAVVEVPDKITKGRGIEFKNPYLSQLTKSAFKEQPTKSWHATKVAGMIAARTDGAAGNDSRYRGVAHGLTHLLDAASQNPNSFAVIEATEWAREEGARIMNFSLGADLGLQYHKFIDRFVDYLARYWGTMVVVAAGNQGRFTGNVTSPGLSYNAITVGSYNSNEDNSFALDEVSAFSSHRPSVQFVVFGKSEILTATVLTDKGVFGPIDSKKGLTLQPNWGGGAPETYVVVANTSDTLTVGSAEDMTMSAMSGDIYKLFGEKNGLDREKPEIVAVGEDNVGDGMMDLLSLEKGGNGKWVQRARGATSFAAPAVTGTCALMAERAGGLLGFPETQKAILLASACIDIEEYSTTRDGVGALVVCEADDIVAGGRFHRREVEPADFDANGYVTHTVHFDQGTGEPPMFARIALCWLADPHEQVQIGKSTGLMPTVLTDTAANFGLPKSKVGYALNPNTGAVPAKIYWVTGNTADTLTVALSVDMTTSAAAMDDYELLIHTQVSTKSDQLKDDTLTHNGKIFGPDNSKAGWLLQPNISMAPGSGTYRVESNTARALTIFTDEGQNLQDDAKTGDVFLLFPHPLKARFNLEVWDKSGKLLPNAVSASKDNNYEFIDFLPPYTGDYEIRVVREEFKSSSESIALAWTQDPCCSPDWGDAPDDMLGCAVPNKGDFPTLIKSGGANSYEYEVEWLSKPDRTAPGASWEVGAFVDALAVEKDEDGKSNIAPPLCLADMDGEDDGVMLQAGPYVAGERGLVTFYVNSATPNLGRYGDGNSDERPDEKIYVRGWFDWEHDHNWSAKNLVVAWEGGPGFDGETQSGDFNSSCVKGCGNWAAGQHQKLVEVEFDVPDDVPEGTFWIRFRLSYGEIPTYFGNTTYGEIEDYHADSKGLTLGCETISCDVATDLNNVADASVDDCVGSDGSLVLHVTNATPNKGTYPLISATAGQVINPPGSTGTLCVGGTIGRYSHDIMTTSGNGDAQLDLMNAVTGGGGGNLPNNLGNLIGGTWNCQWWYRHQSTPTGSRFSSMVTFGPVL